VKRGFTLVEMLIAMAITLVMMGAVVTLFANVSNSVRNRRAVVEVSGQLRHTRNMLQQDLQGATCPGLTWRRPEENEGYIEIIEGPYREWLPSMLTDGNLDSDGDGNPDGEDDELDPALSIIPRNNVVRDYNNNGRVDDDDRRIHLENSGSFVVREDPNNATSPVVAAVSGLGDYDDVLMLTVRNEHEPFVGRVPKSDTAADNGNTRVRPNDADANRFGNWESETITSPLAEVVWYAVENPGPTGNGDLDAEVQSHFGEPGMRTIYRRTLLIAPWLNPYRYIDNNGEFFDTFDINGDNGDQFVAKPGLVRILSNNIDADETDLALAALIAFQEAYDLSVRLEFDPLLGVDGRWKIVANTLGDLTKRENRYEHHFFNPSNSQRAYPYAVVSSGSGYEGDNVTFVVDAELLPPEPNGAIATANLADHAGYTDVVASYSIDSDNVDDVASDPNRRYRVRPFAYVDDDSVTLATARVMLNDEGEVVRLIHGLVPLSGNRRGEDVMLSDVLGFDLRVYDPGAPLFAARERPISATSQVDAILEPSDPAWTIAYLHEDNMDADPPALPGGAIGNGNSDPDNVEFPFVGQGAYVDLGYGFDERLLFLTPDEPPGLPVPRFATAFTSSATPWFFAPEADMQLARTRTPPRVVNRGVLTAVDRAELAPGYAVYDTWSFHYENNGVNEDNDLTPSGSALIDEGTNGLDDPGVYFNASGVLITPAPTLLGPDDVGERETTPPYDRPLRSVQVILRIYERDSRQIRQVRVNQSFVPE
jgi:prepilin-type N-terminal cleavage/methylation domain-containing protein